MYSATPHPSPRPPRQDGDVPKWASATIAGARCCETFPDLQECLADDLETHATIRVARFGWKFFRTTGIPILNPKSAEQFSPFYVFVIVDLVLVRIKKRFWLSYTELLYYNEMGSLYLSMCLSGNRDSGLRP